MEIKTGDTLVGFRILQRNGAPVLQRKIDGQWVDTEVERAHDDHQFSARFADTTTQPKTLVLTGNSAIEKKEEELAETSVPLRPRVQGLPQRTESLKLEIVHEAMQKLGYEKKTTDFIRTAVNTQCTANGLLIKYTNYQAEYLIANKQHIHIKNSALREVINDLIVLAGGKWLEAQQFIH